MNVSDDKIVAFGGFCAPIDRAEAARQIAGFVGLELEDLFHCELCARYPVRMGFWPSEEVFYVIHEEARGLHRLFLRIAGLPTDWHRIEFFPAVRFVDLLPSFSAPRGGVALPSADDAA